VATTESSGRPAAPGPPQDPSEILRSRGYLGILVVGAVIGAPIALVAYWFLQLVAHLQGWLFVDLPSALGLGAPTWWPIPVLVTGGLVVALTIRYLPGHGGASPADGFHSATGHPAPVELVGIALAATVTLGFGAVLGPEGPLIALGGGLAAWAARLLRRDAPAQAVALIGAAGSFAAISTLLGSPLLAAFLLMEVAGIGGAMTSLMLVPGLLAAGIGSLVFIGLDSLTGLGTTSLVIPNLPDVGSPTIGEFGWALAIGVAAAVIGTTIRTLGKALRPRVERRLLVATPAMGLLVALLAVLYAAVTDQETSDVLFSGQDTLPTLVTHSADYSAATLLLLVLCKGAAYALSLGSFRGGPIFPAMLIGAAGGIALSDLPGLQVVAGAAMGIGAMCVVMLGYPLVSVMLPTLLLLGDGIEVIPLVIVAVVVAYVGRAWLDPDGGKLRLVPRTGRPAG
jgi:H+/Cl- antiporter ClcA